MNSMDEILRPGDDVYTYSMTLGRKIFADTVLLSKFQIHPNHKATGCNR